jgi:hypothetical protein
VRRAFAEGRRGHDINGFQPRMICSCGRCPPRAIQCGGGGCVFSTTPPFHAGLPRSTGELGGHEHWKAAPRLGLGELGNRAVSAAEAIEGRMTLP